MRGRTAMSGAGFAGLAVGLIIGAAITYGMAMAIPIGKPYTTTVTTGSQVTTSVSPSEVAYVSIPLGAAKNRSSGFEPPIIVVVLGVNNTVVWADNDLVDHTVSPVGVPAGGSWPAGSQALGPGRSYVHTFTEPGTYSYHCAIHGWMRGVVVVKG